MLRADVLRIPVEVAVEQRCESLTPTLPEDQIPAEHVHMVLHDVRWTELDARRGFVVHLLVRADGDRLEHIAFAPRRQQLLGGTGPAETIGVRARTSQSTGMPPLAHVPPWSPIGTAYPSALRHERPLLT
ncbi:hypothetical protein [Amycolatopsis antarctica]|uniref:hypothetical protein n=1 Tax=Amycolatopsis antarctica TaxID=1854586 RepID=UPI0010564A6D|nr:hypothetical protein [Amycolatopsis antarctica]